MGSWLEVVPGDYLHKVTWEGIFHTSSTGNNLSSSAPLVPGMSLAVITSRTPGSSRASDKSIDLKKKKKEIFK